MSDSSNSGSNSPLSSAKDTVADLADKAGAAAADLKEKARANAADLADSASAKAADLKDKASDLADTAGSKAADLKDKASAKAAAVKDKTTSAATDLATNAKQQSKQGIGFIRENPIGLILSGLAVGFIVGAIAPVSDLEIEKVGPIRDDLVDRAQRVGADVVEHGRSVLDETLAAASASANKHGEALASDIKADLAPAKS